MGTLSDIISSGVRAEDLPSELAAQLDPLLRFVNQGIGGLQQQLQNNLTLTDNIACEVVTPVLSHGVPQLVQLKKLSSAAMVIGASVAGQKNGPNHALAFPPILQQTSTNGQVKITCFFLDSTAVRVQVAIALVPEGIGSGASPSLASTLAKLASVPLGSNGQALTMVGGLPAWGAAGTGLGTNGGRRRTDWTIAIAANAWTPAFTSYGAGSFASSPQTLRNAVAMTLAASNNSTAGSITTAQTEGRWQPLLYGVIRLGSASSIINFFTLDANTGTKGPGVGPSIATSNTGSTSACDDPFVGIIQDTAGDTPTHWLLVSCDGTTMSCVDTGVVATTGTDYSVTIDWTANGTLSCTINGTTVTKSTNLPTLTATLKINFGSQNHSSGAQTGVIMGSVSLEQNE